VGYLFSCCLQSGFEGLVLLGLDLGCDEYPTEWGGLLVNVYNFVFKFEV